MRIYRGTYTRRRRDRKAAAACAAAVLCAVAAGCGGSAARDRPIAGDTLTIYSSAPAEGVLAGEARAVAAGERLALADSRGRVGKYRIRLVALDDAGPGVETWDPSAVQANARRAAADPTAIAYIGELGLGGSAVSVPVTNAAGIVQVSPGDGLTSLTQVQPGIPPTSPARYYPRGKRSFVRLVPTDMLEAATLVAWAHKAGARRIAIVQDDQLFGRELGEQATFAAARLNMVVTDTVQASDTGGANYAPLAQTLMQAQPDAVLYTGTGSYNAGRLLAAIAAQLPDVPLYASSALASASPTPPGLPAVNVLGPAVRANGRATRRVLTRLGDAAGPAGLYGYEAMRLVLDAIRAAGRHANRPGTVTADALRKRIRRSPIGVYGLTGSGDVTTRGFAGYLLRAGGERYLGLRYPGVAAPAPQLDLPSR